jgi:anti-sigma factor RsiW
VSCTNFDWKAYALGELDPAGRNQAEAHANTCARCREELAGLRLTLDALSTLREEEVPRRIAFVSDKVFEPRWWQRIWSPSFAAGCVIAAAILVHAIVQPAAMEQKIDQKIDSAVTKAVAETEQRHAEELQNVLANYEIMRKQNTQMYIQNTGLSRQ